MDPILWPTISIKSDAISGTETVVKLIQRCSFLSHLSLQCRDDISDLLKAVAKNSKRLKNLDIRFCPILTFQDLENLSLHCPEISSLDLECTGCLNKDRDQHEMEGSNTCSCLPCCGCNPSSYPGSVLSSSPTSNILRKVAVSTGLFQRS